MTQEVEIVTAPPLRAIPVGPAGQPPRTASRPEPDTNELWRQHAILFMQSDRTQQLGQATVLSSGFPMVILHDSGLVTHALWAPR